MKSMATRKKAIEIRLCERSSRGMPDSMVVRLTLPPGLGPHEIGERQDAMPTTIAMPRVRRTG